MERVPSGWRTCVHRVAKELTVSSLSEQRCLSSTTTGHKSSYNAEY